MKTAVVLHSIHNQKPLFTHEGTVQITFLVGHNDGVTTLEQKLVLSGTAAGWVAEINLKDFPTQRTPGEAAVKLADWLERMAEAIRKGEYDKIDLGML